MYSGTVFIDTRCIRNLSEDEIANVNFLRRHRTRTIYKVQKLHYITYADVYKNFIMVILHLQLDLKTILSKHAHNYATAYG